MGTPSRVPRSVSTSIFSARRIVGRAFHKEAPRRRGPASSKFSASRRLFVQPDLRYSTSRRASATWPRYASKIRASASSIPTTGFQSRSAHVFVIFGTRFCTSW